MASLAAKHCTENGGTQEDSTYSAGVRAVPLRTVGNKGLAGRRETGRAAREPSIFDTLYPAYDHRRRETIRSIGRARRDFCLGLEENLSSGLPLRLR